MKDKVQATGDDGWEMPERRERAVMSGVAPVRQDARKQSPDKPSAAPEKRPTFDAVSPESNVRLPSGRGVLSPAEIEALLRPNLDDLPDEEDVPEPSKISARPDIDFSTDPGNKPERSATAAETDDAQRLAARLSLALRRDCGLKAAARVTSVSNGPFSDALMGDARGSAVACFTGPDGEISAMLVLSPALSAALIETACGGAPGQAPAARRALTPLDAALLEGLVRPVGAALSSHFNFARIETDAGFAAALAPPGAANYIHMNVRVDTAELPARLIIADNDLFDTAPARTDDASLFDAPDPAALSAPIPASARTPRAVTALLTVRIASLSVPLSRLTNLKAGSTLLLGVPADQPAELLSGGRDGPVIAEGDVGRRGGKMALRIARKIG